MTNGIVAPPAADALALALAAESNRWVRGHRKSDGLPFVLFTGSKGATYMTSERGCSCPSYRHRGQCSHHVAVQQHQADVAAEYQIEQQLADIAGKRQRPIVSYRELFPEDDE